MAALNLATLPALPSSVAKPAYDPRAIGVGIVHLGLGAFHRAHQAFYVDTLLHSDKRWAISALSPRR